MIHPFGKEAAYIINAGQPSPEEVGKISVGLLQVCKKIDPESAASMNGCLAYTDKIFAIGVGALGSQIFNNLIRAGYGKWVVIDPDILLPHNCARHFLGDWAVAGNKAEAMSHVANQILDGADVVKHIAADFLKPEKHQEEIESAMAEASIVLDFSASVAVSRHLACTEKSPRCLTAYLSPDGSSLCVAIEDSSRAVRLDWLEMLHYRAALTVEDLRETFLSSESHLRYGNACRDVRSVVSQDDVGMWAGFASREIKRMQAVEEASIKLFSRTSDGGVKTHEQVVKPVMNLKLRSWNLVLDEWLLLKARQFRVQRLPNETGGVLLGCFDTASQTCYIVDLIPSPPDSEEWPMSYIRGCEGLRQQVVDVENRTLGQITYVGEWHSHPDGASVMPSGDDMQAYSWLESNMIMESLPALMMIFGDENRFSFVVR